MEEILVEKLADLKKKKSEVEFLTEYMRATVAREDVATVINGNLTRALKEGEKEGNIGASLSRTFKKSPTDTTAPDSPADTATINVTDDLKALDSEADAKEEQIQLQLANIEREKERVQQELKVLTQM